MNIMQYPRMLTSTHEGWDELERWHPDMNALFLWLVLPLSVLPPVMILLASGGLGAEIFPGAHIGDWLLAATFFFVAEHVSVPMMAGVVRRAALAQGAAVTLRDAYTVAAVAPVPLWLSSIGLLTGTLWLAIPLTLVALAAACVLIHNGVRRVLGIKEDVIASEMAVQVMTMGVLAWGVLLVVTVVPLAVL